MSLKNSDNTLLKANDLGQLSGGKSIRDAVGKNDRVDFFRFTLSGRSSFSTALDRKAKADLKLFDSNGAVLARSPKQSKTIKSTLEAGTYYISVSRRGGDSKYRMTTAASAIFSTPFPDPGLTIDQAFDVGTLSRGVTYRDSVGTADVRDYYKFSLNQTSNFRAVVDSPSDGISTRLIQDINRNGTVDYDETLEGGYDNVSGAIINNSLGSGVYFLEVSFPSFASTENANYNLDFSVVPNPDTTSVDPGNSISTAYNLGTLLTPSTSKNFVGAADSRDLYTLSLNRAANLRASISGATDQININLFSDRNSDGRLDYSERLAGNSSSSTNINPAILFGVQPGTYFVEVYTTMNSSNTAYTLTIDG